jgi:EmrB/QacA subfamily drug resistance transporter
MRQRSFAPRPGGSTKGAVLRPSEFPLSEPVRSESPIALAAVPGAAKASSRPLVLAAAVGAILISSIEGTIVATVMPQIVGQLGGFDLFSWVFTAYLLTQAVTIPIYGRLADLYGRKRMLLWALGLFLGGSVLCGCAWSMVSLIGFRIVQGIGAGGLVPIAQTVVGDLYTPVERAKLQGYLSSVWAIGSIVGPLLGAFLVAHTIWPMVFWINVPIGIVVVAMLVLWLHEDLKQRLHRIDYVGALLMMLGSGVLMFALVQGPHLGGRAFAVLMCCAIAFLALFVLHERRSPEPMLPIALLKNRIIGAGAIGCFALGATIMGSSAFLSLYVQGVMGRSAIIAGIVLMTPSVTWPIGSSSGGWIMLRTSYRTTCAIGAVPLIAGSLIMVALDPASGPLLAGIGAGLIGVGMGLTNNTFTVAIQGSVGWAQRGIATSTMSFMRQVGQALGAAVFGGTINAALATQGAGSDIVDRIMDPVLRRGIAAEEIAPLTTAIAHGLHVVYLITAALCLVVLGTALLLPPGLNPLRAQRPP